MRDDGPGFPPAVLGRLGEPDDVARAVSLLVSADAGWINGQVLRVNGGII